MAKDSISQKPRLLWGNILFMTLSPLAAAVLIPLYLAHNGSSWGLWLFFMVSFAINNLIITSGYHRYFSHRSYEVSPVIQWLYVLIGSAAFQGSVLQWASDHRRHHRLIDTEGDPYNIKNGFLYAHVTWMFREASAPHAEIEAPDLEKSALLRFQHAYYPYIATFMGFIVPGGIGWALGLGFGGGLLFGGLMRIVATQHSTFLINSYAHTFGRQTYSDKHSARDSLILALMTFGEGYHNYHHSFQADFRNGIRWYHWDPTKWWIQLLSWIGLARRLKVAQKEEILRVRLALEEKIMLAKGAPRERVEKLRTRIEEAQLQLRQLREAYLTTKRTFKEKRSAWGQWKHQMRADIRIAEIEFRAACVQWRTLRRALMKSTAST